MGARFGLEGRCSPASVSTADCRAPIGHPKLAVAQHGSPPAPNRPGVAELHEAPPLLLRRVLAGVQELVASVDRVELDDMALELGKRHLLVLLQDPARQELDRFCSDNGIVLGPRHAPHGPPLRRQQVISFTRSCNLPLPSLQHQVRCCVVRARSGTSRSRFREGCLFS